MLMTIIRTVSALAFIAIFELILTITAQNIKQVVEIPIHNNLGEETAYL
ncbi:MAG: hypothetical protein LBR68_00660 [Lachnoclostridium sp.]|jgi:hypothetical protein|nr:hypothetical protein [Lachnoclostridium sp.]